MHDFIGRSREWICRDFIRLYGAEALPVAAREVGQVWSADFDIDVAATLLDGSSLAGECKWWASPVGVNILDHLRDSTNKTRYFTPSGADRYVIFSRSGFTPDLREMEHGDPRVRLIGPGELAGPDTQ